ncbi:pathogenesis-related protein 1B-like [Andrographis paniculata]|uniref:pathogenesis-related protein 1B-like n=1 Tax=Andrographis paniculata TaxID=175694 RepID=UPI0021E7082A|nr:pathogenesis-related protein 1B-like [Andrographis paniculata]
MMMMSRAAAAAVILIITTTTGACVHAQNSRQDFLDGHNAARSEVGVGPMTWDDTVAAFAENYVGGRLGDCQLVHSQQQYGENLAAGGGEGFDFTGKDAVGLWVDEKKNYDHVSNTCAEGQVCGHYTQVVWRDSVRLGCARAQCANGQWFVSCNYDPPGNVQGQSPY